VRSGARGVAEWRAGDAGFRNRRACRAMGRGGGCL